MRKVSVNEVADILEVEGLGDAITSYLSHDSIENTDLAAKWKKAKALLEEIEDFVEYNRDLSSLELRELIGEYDNKTVFLDDAATPGIFSTRLICLLKTAARRKFLDARLRVLYLPKESHFNFTDIKSVNGWKCYDVLLKEADGLANYFDGLEKSHLVVGRLDNGHSVLGAF